MNKGRTQLAGCTVAMDGTGLRVNITITRLGQPGQVTVDQHIPLSTQVPVLTAQRQALQQARDMLEDMLTSLPPGPATPT